MAEAPEIRLGKQTTIDDAGMIQFVAKDGVATTQEAGDGGKVCYITARESNSAIRFLKLCNPFFELVVNRQRSCQ